MTECVFGEPRGDSDLAAPLFPGVKSTALRTAIQRACTATGTPLFSPRDLKHRRVSLLHAQGKTWAQVAEIVGNASADALAKIYTHVPLDEREIDYASVLTDRLQAPAERVLA